MATVFSLGYPDHAGDIDWLEYRMERRLLEAYEDKWEGLPPGNFQHGSRRSYMEHLLVEETGDLRVLGLPPANLPSEVLDGLRQSVKKWALHMSDEDIKAELERLRAENELRTRRPAGLRRACE